MQSRLILRYYALNISILLINSPVIVKSHLVQRNPAALKDRFSVHTGTQARLTSSNVTHVTLVGYSPQCSINK